jgi:hypothetical protein
MTTSTTFAQSGTEDQESLGRHRAFLSKMERDQKARRANAHRHHMNWFIFDFSWETTDEETLALDLADSERLYREELEHSKVA